MGSDYFGSLIMWKLFSEIKLQVHDKNGLLLHSHSEPCNSHLAQYIQHLLTALQGSHIGARETTTGTLRSLERPVDSSAHWMYMNAADGDDDFGIIVGTGNTAVAIDDRYLATRIAVGTGSTQLTYGAHTFSTVSSYRQFTVSRAFGNPSSGGSITVAEIGIGVSSQYETTTAGLFMIERTVLGSTVTVSDGQTLTVEYTIDIPSI